MQISKHSISALQTGSTLLFSQTRDAEDQKTGAHHFVPRRLLPLFLMAAMVAASIPVFAADSDTEAPDTDTGVAEQAERPVDALPVEDYFIVTRLDTRLCPAPGCGGFFVARVNTDVSRCADGTWQRECHASRIEFPVGHIPGPEPLSGVTDSANQPVDLQAALEQGVALERQRRAAPERNAELEPFRPPVLIRGELERKRVGVAGLETDVLIAHEVWLGRTGHQPKGHFSRLDPLNIVCVTHPCPQYAERSLNTNLVGSLSALRLSSPSLPFPLPMSSFLAVGEHEQVTGPAGSMNVLVASEIYEPLTFITEK